MTDLATTPDAALDTISSEEAELAQLTRSKIDRKDLVLPMLKLAQGLTAEVSDGKAKSGQFVNSLTGEAFDGPLEFIVVDYVKGRFFSPKGGGTYVAFGTDVVPDNWPPEYAGQHFSDLDDAEEQYAERANRGDIEWGDGPPIRTTYNYVGIPVDDPELPVRVSMQRTSKGAARKLNTLIDTAPTPWARVFSLSAIQQQNDHGVFYVFDVSRGRRTTDDERAAAIELAKSINSAAVNVEFHDDEVEAAPAKPAAKAADPDALDID